MSVDLTEAKWRGKLKHGLLLEVFGLSQDELKAPHTDSSGEERHWLRGIHLADHSIAGT